MCLRFSLVRLLLLQEHLSLPRSNDSLDIELFRYANIIERISDVLNFWRANIDPMRPQEMLSVHDNYELLKYDVFQFYLDSIRVSCI